MWRYVSCHQDDVIAIKIWHHARHITLDYLTFPEQMHTDTE